MFSQFKRVLELPTENWQELAKDWCCHANSLPNMAMGPLKPIPGDCLVGDHYVSLHPSSMEPNSVAITLVSILTVVLCKHFILFG